MAIPLIDNFKINSELPIDDRTIATSSTERDAIKFKYDGLKVFQLNNRITYQWNKSKYQSTGITSSSWDTVNDTLVGQGTFNYLSKWDSTGLGLTNSSVLSYPRSFNEDNEKVCIGGTPSEAFQVNGNYSLSALGTSSMPFVIHKGISTIIGENWYYDIGLSQDKVFNTHFASSTLSFKNGGFEFRGRTAGSGSTMRTHMTINSDSSTNFNSYVSITGTTSDPNTANDGSISYNSEPNTNRLKVKEVGLWRTISRVYDVYTCYLSQLGTSAPSETILESTILTGTWSYVSTGIYNLTISNGFVGEAPRINGFCGPYTSASVFFGEKISDSVYQIRTLFSAGTTASNNVLDSTLIEIRIYPMFF